MKSQGYCGVGRGLLGTLDQEGRTDSVKVLPGTSVFLSSESGMSGNFLGCIEGVKYHFELQDRTWDFS